MGKVLLLFEGKVFEPQIFEATLPVLAPEFPFVSKENTIVCEYCTHIYTLYANLKNDPGLDLIGLLCEDLDKYPRLREAISGCEYPQDMFEAIYLLFDYDGHINMPRDKEGANIDGDVAISEMLNFFNATDENGKLLISYPMVESIKHLANEPITKQDIITSKCKGPHCQNNECKERLNCPPVRRYYKALVNECQPHRSRLDNISSKEWAEIFDCHVKVAKLLCDNGEDINSQQELFNIQLRDYISQQCPKVAVLNSFPFLFLDFMGEINLKERIHQLISS